MGEDLLLAQRISMKNLLAIRSSPTHEVLIEKAVIGWKEYELELLRDSADHVTVVCTVKISIPSEFIRETPLLLLLL